MKVLSAIFHVFPPFCRLNYRTSFDWRCDCQVRGVESNLNERISILFCPLSVVNRAGFGGDAGVKAAAAVISRHLNRAKLQRLVPPQTLSSRRQLPVRRRSQGRGGRWESAARDVRFKPGEQFFHYETISTIRQQWSPKPAR